MKAAAHGPEVYEQAALPKKASKHICLDAFVIGYYFSELFQRKLVNFRHIADFVT